MTPCRHRSPAPVATFTRKPSRNLYRCDCAAATQAGVTTLRNCRRCPLADSLDCESREVLEYHAAMRAAGLPRGCSGC